MFKTIIRSLACVLLLVVVTNAQSSGVVRPSKSALNERARQLEPHLVSAARKYGVDAGLLRILCFMESRFRVEVVSPKGARGPMQLMPDTARRYGVLNPHNPQQAIDAAAHYLRDLLTRFGGRVDLALAAYNSGEGTVESFLTGRQLQLPSGKIINPNRLITGGVPPYPETRNYVRQGLTMFQRSVASQSSFPRQYSIPRSGSMKVLRNFTLDAVVAVEQSSTKSNLPVSSFIDVQ